MASGWVRCGGAATIALLSVLTSVAATAAFATPSDGPSRAPDDTSTGLGASVCVETMDRSPFTPGTATRDCDSPPPQGDPVPVGWSLAWSDEFEGTSVDRSKWNVLNNSTYGDGNQELACLTNRPENVRVSGGALTISAQRESGMKCGSNDRRFPGGRSYSSGHLETKGKASFEYGRFEVRAKSPTAFGQSKGVWPAFWLRPVDGGKGEIDVVENIGSSATEKNTAARTNQTIHYDYVRTHPKQGTSYLLPTGTFADGFHTYAVEWEPGVIRWYVDGVLTWERNRATTPWIDEAFSRDFYLRLNMAVGGTWPGSPDAKTAFPADFVVDYVRVYQRP